MTVPKEGKILIIEDEVSLLNILTDKLTREGFLVVQAKNGEEGLEVALREHPDLMLLDIIMPKMDGIAMLKELQQDEWGKNAKVIIFSNLSENEKIDKALGSGSYEYLIKADWKIGDVVTKIRKILSKL